MNYLTEKEIWTYLDGSASPAEQSRIKEKLAADPVYAAQFAELKALHESLVAMEPDEPSMSFTRNVMEKVKLEPLPQVKKWIDPRIIWSISGFFLLSLVALIGYALTQADLSADVSLPQNLSLPAVKLDLSKYMNSTFTNVLIFLNVVVGLAVLDGYLRRKNQKTEKIKNL